MNDIFFSNSFAFRTYSFDKFHYTDNRTGALSHYFAYMISGNCKITTKKEVVYINEGDVFYIPNESCYQSYWYGTPKIKFISLGFVYMPNFDNKSYPIQVIQKNDKIIELFQMIANKTQLTPADIGTFYTLSGILIPLMSSVTLCRTREIVEETKKYLFQHPFAQTSELARNCAISEAALYSAFKKSSDITVNRLRNRIILEKAKEMLIATDKSIEYISELMGFSSTSYFRKKFKGYFNMTPGEMRKTYRI